MAKNSFKYEKSLQLQDFSWDLIESVVSLLLDQMQSSLSITGEQSPEFLIEKTKHLIRIRFVRQDPRSK